MLSLSQDTSTNQVVEASSVSPTCSGGVSLCLIPVPFVTGSPEFQGIVVLEFYCLSATSTGRVSGCAPCPLEAFSPPSPPVVMEKDLGRVLSKQSALPFLPGQHFDSGCVPRWSKTFMLLSGHKGCPGMRSFTAGLLISDEPTNNQFANEPEGLRHFRDHRWKALGEENPILSGLFLFRHYFESYTE